MKEAVTRTLDTLNLKDYEEGFQELAGAPQQDYCNEVGGTYFQGDYCFEINRYLT